jgi:hypothetical protein
LHAAEDGKKEKLVRRLCQPHTHTHTHTHRV